jgi:hypothetical protein
VDYLPEMNWQSCLLSHKDAQNSTKKILKSFHEEDRMFSRSESGFVNHGFLVNVVATLFHKI